MVTLVHLLAQARQHHLVLTVGTDGSLNVDGPRTAGTVARALLARKVDVVPLVDFYAGTVTSLSWKHARLAPQDSRCVLCRKPCLLTDPYDGQVMHKTCAEYAITTGRWPTATTEGLVP